MDNHGHHLLLSISTIPGDTSLCDNQRNSGYFEQEIQKLGAWVDDLTLELEREIKKIDCDIKEVRCAVVILPVMEEKLSWQEEWFVLWTISWKPTSTADQGTLTWSGSLWITIDDNEAHYLKVLCDEVFGRGNFVANVVWQKKYAVANDHKTIAPVHDHLLIYRKSEKWERNLIPRTKEKDRQYKFEDERGVFRTSDYTCSKSYEERPNLYYLVTQPNTGEKIWLSKTRVWAYSQEEHLRHVTEGFIYWGKDGSGKIPLICKSMWLEQTIG